MFKANIRREEGIPRLYINDELTPPMLLWLNTEERSRDDLNTAQAREFGARGMHLYSAIAHLPLSGVDFEDCRAAMRCIIAGDPEARILLRVSMSPTGAEADEWCVTHPDDKMDWHVVHTTPYNNGMVNETSIVGTAPSAVTVASDEWFAAAQNAVINLYRALNEDPAFSEHLLGLHVGGGETCEWFHYGLRERGIDYSPANAKKIRRMAAGEVRRGVPRHRPAGGSARQRPYAAARAHPAHPRKRPPLHRLRRVFQLADEPAHP